MGVPRARTRERTSTPRATKRTRRINPPVAGLSRGCRRAPSHSRCDGKGTNATRFCAGDCTKRTVARFMQGNPCGTPATPRATVSDEVVPEPRVRFVPRRRQLAPLHALLHFTIGLVHVRAVRETAQLGRLVEFRKVIAQRRAIQIPQPELANPRRIDQIRPAAEVVER